jgi:hypothetical protein
MDDSTKTGGTVVPLYTADSAGRNSPRKLQGTLLTFVDKQFLAGTGSFRTEIPLGTRCVVMEVWAGYKLWLDGRVVECVAAIDGRYPMRHELGQPRPARVGPRFRWSALRSLARQSRMRVDA